MKTERGVFFGESERLSASPAVSAVLDWLFKSETLINEELTVGKKSNSQL
jgi:hypothetical protein